MTNTTDQQVDQEASGAENSDNEVEKGEMMLQEAHMFSMQREGSFRLCGILVGQRVISLFDIGATPNFIDAWLVAKRGIQTRV